jgi:hypothetical protein
LFAIKGTDKKVFPTLRLPNTATSSAEAEVKASDNIFSSATRPTSVSITSISVIDSEPLSAAKIYVKYRNLATDKKLFVANIDFVLIR